MLLLRQACQPLLDRLGLNNLHVTIDQKTLTIVGQCGNPLVAISGIKFSRNSASNEERDFATQLFASFLDKHKESILDFVKQKQAFTELPRPELPSDATSYYISSDKNSSQVYFKNYNATQSSSTINVYRNGQIQFYSFVPTIEFLQNNINEFSEMHKATVAFLDKLEEYREQEKIINNLQAALAKCDI